MVPNQIIQEMFVRRAIPFMGEPFEICIESDDEQWAFNLVESAIAEVRRIERMRYSRLDKKYAAERVQLILQQNEVTCGAVKVPGICITWAYNQM